MGQRLAELSPAARAIFQRADDALGWSLSTLCWHGPEERLTLTANAQPAIVATSIATLAALKERWPELPAPDYAAGHSLGEYSALVASGALDLEDAVRLVHLRGQAMQDAVPDGVGAMAAILGGDAATVGALCEEAAAGEVLAPANFNGPGQVVIAGTAGAVERARALAATKKLKAIPLKVSAPFHCALMEPAAHAVAAALARLRITPLAFPVIANVDARPNQAAARVPELLTRQVASPVQWHASVQCMTHAGVTQALEFGAGRVLAGLVKRIDPALGVFGVAEPESLTKARDFLEPSLA